MAVQSCAGHMGQFTGDSFQSDFTISSLSSIKVRTPLPLVHNWGGTKLSLGRLFQSCNVRNEDSLFLTQHINMGYTGKIQVGPKPQFKYTTK